MERPRSLRHATALPMHIVGCLLIRQKLARASFVVRLTLPVHVQREGVADRFVRRSLKSVGTVRAARALVVHAAATAWRHPAAAISPAAQLVCTTASYPVRMLTCDEASPNMASMEGNWQLVSQVAKKPMDFKRTFMLDPMGGLLIENPRSADEQLLKESRTLYTGVKLMRGLWTEGAAARSGTFFPLTAPADKDVVWASAGHRLMADKQSHWRCGYGTQVQPISPSSKPAHRAVLDLGLLRDGSELVEYIPSQPTQRISSANVMPDFGFMVAKAPEQGLSHLLIPSARQLACGDPVCVLGFAEQLNVEWARTFLRTQADFDEAVEEAQLMGHSEPSPEDWRLDDGTAVQRALRLLDDVCFPSNLVAAPGLVAGASQRIIEHTCSTFPGMSGGPGVDVQNPWQLLFVHTCADRDFRRNNYGYSVHHPLFVKAYEREVLPRLLDTPTELLSVEMLRCLRGYLDVNKEQLADATVLRRVEQRC